MIGACCFISNNNLKSLNIPTTIEEIGYDVKDMGDICIEREKEIEKRGGRREERKEEEEEKSE